MFDYSETFLYICSYKGIRVHRLFKNMQQELFEIEKPFKHRSRGSIYNEVIWPELDVNSRINIRSNYGNSYKTKPNYQCLLIVFREGLDMAILDKSQIGDCYYMTHGLRKVKPR